MEHFFDDINKTKPYPAELSEKEDIIVDKIGKTVPYQYGSDYGFPKDDSATVAYQAATPPIARTVSHNLGIGDIIELNSIEYEILEILSEEGKTAEAVIYKIRDGQDRIFVLKLYYEFNDEHHEPNSDTLQRIREIGGKDILLLFDFGTGPNKYLDKYCFEVAAYAAGGDLIRVEDIKEKYTPDFIEKVVIQGMHNGLCTLHSEKIYHCDIKPQNVFFVDEAQTQIVIGDYGSAKSFEKSSEKELSYTTITKGTEFYLAPEQAFGIVSEKNDYYSLGMVVLHLLYPGQVTRQNLRRIFERRTKGLPIIDFDENYERLNQLIEGLTLQDYNSRWGAKEVETWLSGNEVTVNYGIHDEVKHLRIGDETIKSGKELAVYVESGNRFFDELIDDREGYSLLLTWVKGQQGEQNMKQFDAMVSHYKKYFGIEYVKEAMLFYFNAGHRIQIGMHFFEFNANTGIEKLSKEYFKIMDELWKISDFDTIRLYFFRFEFALRRLRVKADKSIIKFIDKTFRAIAEIIDTSYYPDFSELKADVFINLQKSNLPEIFYLFDDSRSFNDLSGVKYSTLFEVCEFLKSNPPKHDDDFLQFEKNAFLKNLQKDDFIEFLEYSDNINEFFLNQKADFEILAGLISKFCEKKYSSVFVRNVLLSYRKYSAGIIKEVIVRLIKPDTPINVMGTDIYLYQKGNFKSKIEEFFMALENARINASFENAQQSFFSFEFSMMQLVLNDGSAGKSLVDPVFSKINTILQTNPPDCLNLKATFFKQINETNLLDLLYKFHPSRVFCTHNGDYLNTVEEIGLYYLQYPDQYNLKVSAIERKAFLLKSGNRGLMDLDFKDFMFKIFQLQSSYDVTIKKMIFDENATNEVTYYYNYEVSIDDFLQSKNIDTLLQKKNDSIQKIVIHKKSFASDDELYEDFTKALRQKYAFKSLAPHSRKSFNEALDKLKKVNFFESFFLIPRYLLYLLPVFGMVYLSLSFLLDTSLFRQISYNLSPTLNLVFVRMATSYIASLLFATYILNLMVGIFLLLPILSLKRKKERYDQFTTFYSPVVSRLTLIMAFAPLLFTGLYSVFDVLFGDGINNFTGLGYELRGISLTVIIYVVFLFYETMKVIKAFFKVSKKIRILPMIITILIYFILGYFAFIYYNNIAI